MTWDSFTDTLFWLLLVGGPLLLGISMVWVIR